MLPLTRHHHHWLFLENCTQLNEIEEVMFIFSLDVLMLRNKSIAHLSSQIMKINPTKPIGF